MPFCLWIGQVAPSFIPCDYVVKEFVVYQPYRWGHRKWSFLFVFVRVSTSEIPNLDKRGACATHHEEFFANFLRNYNLWRNLVHIFPSVTSHSLSHTLDTCFICWPRQATTTRIIVKTLASIMEAFTQVMHLRHFHGSVTIRLLQNCSRLHWRFLKPNTKSDIRIFFNYSRFQLRSYSSVVKIEYMTQTEFNGVWCPVETPPRFQTSPIIPVNNFPKQNTWLSRYIIHWTACEPNSLFVPSK
jgi:hypothetical protein